MQPGGLLLFRTTTLSDSLSCFKLMTSLKHSCPFRDQSEVKVKPVVTRPPTSSQASRRLHVLASILIGSLDCVCF